MTGEGASDSRGQLGLVAEEVNVGWYQKKSAWASDSRGQYWLVTIEVNGGLVTVEVMAGL